MERQDGAKRRQIMDGARAVFLAQGFDAASMGDIARKAGVSKGTLYVYFDSEVAAAQFLESSHATISKPLLFNAADPPSDERINHVVGIAVRTFLAAYRR